MKKIIAALALAAPMFGAHAAPIVDTGVAPGTGWEWSFSQYQYFAAEFTTTQAHTINSLEGYFSTSNSGNVSFAISTDGGNMPGATLFSKTVAIDGDGVLAWHGAFGLDYLLDAGTYWLSFVPDAAIDGTMPGSAVTPVGDYAQGGWGGWGDYGPGTFNYLRIAARIDGDAPAQSDVPEPASPALAAIAALGLMLARRRKGAKRQG